MTQPAEQDLHPTADVSALRIARVYADALLTAAERKGQGDAVLEELDSLVQDVFRADPNVEQFLNSPAVNQKDRAAAIQSVFGPRASPLFTDFLLVLNDHGRLPLLPLIRTAYRELHDQRANRVRVWVRSATPLQDDQRRHLEEMVRSAMHVEPILEARVDPSLLGGLVVRVGDMQYDGSVRTRLQTIKNQILERSSYEIQRGRDRFSSDARN